MRDPAGNAAVAVTRTLDVHGTPIPPSILTALVDTTAAQGETISFEVQAAGMPVPIDFEWSHDGVIISDSSRITGALTHKLTIKNASHSDIGNYTVIVRNGVPDPAVSSAHLNVIAVRPPLAVHIVEQEAEQLPVHEAETEAVQSASQLATKLPGVHLASHPPEDST